MAENLDLSSFAYALGRYVTGWRFADPSLRRLVNLRAASAAWDQYRLDAGPDEVGRQHEPAIEMRGVLSVNDPRRDSVLLWLADHGAPAIAEAAELLARMVGAAVRFGADALDLLDEAREAIAAAAGPADLGYAAAEAPPTQVRAPIAILTAAVHRLRASERFREGVGEEVLRAVPGGVFGHYVPAIPGAAWALNLALLTPASPFAPVPPVPSLVRRALFRPECGSLEVADEVVEVATKALTIGCEAIEELDGELARGRAGLTHLSRNARAGEAWALVAALGSVTRMQLARGLGLSRAGADIQARVLADAGLIRLGRGGRIDWLEQQLAPRSSLCYDQPADALGAAITDLDASMAEIDRLLARTSR